MSNRVPSKLEHAQVALSTKALIAKLNATAAALATVMEAALIREDSASTDSLAVSPARAARLIGVSTALVYTLLSARRLRAVKLDGRTLILRDELVAFLRSLPPWTPARDRKGDSTKRPGD